MSHMEENYVDITKEPVVTAVEWFHGYGGNALGLKRAIPGLRSIAVCERDAFVVANMVAKMEAGLMDAVPIWSDCKTFPVEPFRGGWLDLFIASYPCQGFSHAGKRLGAKDERHLWPYCRRFIQGARPGLVWLENVEGHVSLGLSTVLADLEEDGYRSAFGIFSASEVGAPHQRKRVFILAYDKSRGPVGFFKTGESERETSCGGRFDNSGEDVAYDKTAEPLRAGTTRTGGAGLADGSSEELAHQQQQGLQGHAGDVNSQGGEPGGADRPVAEGGLLGGQVWPSRPGQAQYGFEPPRVVGHDKRSLAESENIGREIAGEVAGRSPESSGGGKVESPLGGNADGPASGVDIAGLSEECNKKLENICGDVLMITKVCPKCGIEKALFEFFKNKAKADGLSSNCKKCHMETLGDRSEYLKEYRATNKASIVSWAKEYYETNRVKIRKNQRKFYELHKAEKEYSEQRRKYWDKYYANNRETVIKSGINYRRELRKRSPEYRAKDNIGRRVRSYLKGISSSGTIKCLLGCSREELLAHLERQFLPGMDWSNYGEWHIDHILPCASFNFAIKEEQRKCFHFSNLRPLWAKDNQRKYSKILSDPELAEIRAWMVKGTNRTDELRLCGNGVVPSTAEKAFRVLYAEICGRRWYGGVGGGSSPTRPKRRCRGLGGGVGGVKRSLRRISG